MTSDLSRLPFRARLGDWLLSATVLGGAWLLFQVQPMAGKRILPWFGGGPAVWTTAMLFFQALLLAGYLYAHLTSRWLRPRTQAVLHAVLLVIAATVLAIFGVAASDEWKPLPDANPQAQILRVLAVSVGLPYTMLAATSPLVQIWLGRTGKSPYRLYALSNLGSLGALLSYPLIIEPFLGIRVQGLVWSGLFAVFALCCAVSGWISSRSSSVKADSLPAVTPSDKPTPTTLDRLYWLLLPTCASVVLLAVTNYISQDVAPVPLLWIAPLTLYLLSFILTFESDRWYRRWPWLAAMMTFSFIACWSWRYDASEPFQWQVFVHLALLFAICMVCHGEVARLRPPTTHLTSFYLHLSVGGVFGGLLVAVVAPYFFIDFYELPIGVLAAWLLAVLILLTDRNSSLRYGAWFAIIMLGTMFSMMAWYQYANAQSHAIAAGRNFFGVLKVQEFDHPAAAGRTRQLVHGRILHGSQFLDDARRAQPTQYFGRVSGVGQLLERMAGRPRRVGIAGLGVGTLAAYAQSGDDFTFYDVDPQIVDFAERYFTYLSDARIRGAVVKTVIADARLAMEREPSQAFDLLVLDAFSGDAIPVHLLTMEAFELYIRHLRPQEGILAVQITNRNVDLAPVIQTVASRWKLDARIVSSSRNEVADLNAAVWILLYQEGGTPGPDRVGQPLSAVRDPSRAILWTDDHSSLLGVLKQK